MNRFPIYCFCILSAGVGFGGESLPDRVERFLQPKLQVVEPSPIDRNVVEEILARPDPGTFFLRYAFAISRKADKLLSPEQAVGLQAIIDRNSVTGNRWHDERNTLRCKYNQVMWRYVAAGEEESHALRDELARWMDLRMQWTRQEHLAQYRFAREVWQLLTPDQKQLLLDGEWKSYVKLETGHTRGDFTEKVIRKALGDPDDAAVLKKELTAWSERRKPLHEAVSASENEERCIVFAMDRNNEAMAAEACHRSTDAYEKLYLAEAEAMRIIVRSAYEDATKASQVAAGKAWRESATRFEGGAGELIELIEDQ